MGVFKPFFRKQLLQPSYQWRTEETAVVSQKGRSEYLGGTKTDECYPNPDHTMSHFIASNVSPKERKKVYEDVGFERKLCIL